MKKIYVGIIIFIFVALAGLFFAYNQLNQKNNIINDMQAKVSVAGAKAPEPAYPKIETYKIPILMYHYIRVVDPADTLGVGLSVTPKNFAEQMNWLSENNYETLKLEELADPEKKVISRIIGTGKKPIVITFDDGYEDAHTNAMPVLQKNNFIGTFFIIRDFVGRPEYATQTQIDEMAATGMEIGSHTLSHKDLAKNSIEVDRKQIFDSKFGAIAFCYPSGRFNEDAVNLVKEAGYKVAVTTKDGIADQDSNLLELPRVRIKNIDLATFAQRVQGLK